MPRTQFYSAPRKKTVPPLIYRFSAADECKLQLVPHQHLEKLRDGTGNVMAWETLRWRVNLAVVLTSMLIPDRADVCDELAAAVSAVCQVGKRYTERGKMGCSGDEFRAIAYGLGRADELQLLATRKQLLQASQRVLRELQALPGASSMPTPGGLA